MKAAVFLGNRKIQIQEPAIPEPAADQVLIKITGCGVCGTDAHIFSGELDVAKPPVVIGHEITGIIEAIGSKVSGFRPGQTISVDPVIACGKCSYCHSGQPNLCRNRTTIGYVWDGGFQQYMVAPATHIYPISAEVGIKGGILVETLACVINGHNRLQPQAGKSALILGAGTVGCLWNQLLRQSPITHLLQTEIVPFRQQMAAELGADHVINPRATNLAEAVFSKFPEGVDYIIDATGDADAIAEALPLVRRGGTFMIFGVCAQNAKITISPFDIYEREMKIIASKMPPQTLDPAVRLIESGRINFDKLVTTIMPLEQTATAFDMFETQKNSVLKIAIDPWAS